MADCFSFTIGLATQRTAGSHGTPRFSLNKELFSKRNGCLNGPILAVALGLLASDLVAQEIPKTDKSPPSVEIQLKLLPSAPEPTEQAGVGDKGDGDKGDIAGGKGNGDKAGKPEEAKKPGKIEKDQSPGKAEKFGGTGKPESSLMPESTKTGAQESQMGENSKGRVGISFQPLRRPSTDSADQMNSEECPGGSTELECGEDRLASHPDDIPLEQEEHPFDCPAAMASNPEQRFQKISQKRIADLGFTDSELSAYEGIEALLQYYRENPENVVRRGPWALMHAILPFGVESEVIAGNRSVNAIGWLCHNGVSGRQRMFQPTKTGFRPNIGPGVQGHEGQFLAILAQSHVQPDYPLQIGNKKYSLMDLVRFEMATCREKTELTFKLIAFSHYLSPDHSWRDNRGRPWTIEKLVAEELAQPINGAACGGTHRLMGLACAVLRRQEAGLPMTGHYRRAEIFLDDFVAYAMTMQNPDGSFSTEWFEHRANEPNVDRKIQTTGHILEWLVYTISEEELRRPEILAAVNFLLDTLGKNPERDWPIGPRGHSLRALALYQKRLFHTTLDEARVASQPAVLPAR